MPLAFESTSHGRIAFGFFNIESDMLLLENYFFFSTDFCAHMISLAKGKVSSETSFFPVVIIDQTTNIGDLMGAIHGTHHTGFIGALYQHYPFPSNPADFKQKTKGKATQETVGALITNFGHEARIAFFYDPNKNEVTIGAYRFSRSGFHELIDYVWRGGMPLWEGNTPPDHVKQMQAIITQSDQFLFKGMVFTNS